MRDRGPDEGFGLAVITNPGGGGDHSVRGSQLNVAVLFPRITVHSGGVERTLKVIEHSRHANISYTVLQSKDNIQDREVQRRLELLERSSTIALGSLSAHGASSAGGSYDALVIPSEFWMPALRKARAAGIKATAFIEFHQLPYIGTLDVLKAVGVDHPTLPDLVQFPLVSSRFLGGNVALSTFQTVACSYSVRSASRLRDAHVMAVTPVTSKNLRSFGYSGKLFVPKIHAGVEWDLMSAGKAEDDGFAFDAAYVGRFHPHKGFLDLPAIAAYLRKYWKEDVRIAVCGSPQFRRHWEIFEKRVKALGVERNLVLLKWLPQDELYSTMRSSRMILYPSYVDAFSITVLESLALGVPVVAYAIDALEMIWGSRRGVFLSPVGEPAAIARLCASIVSDSRVDEARKEAGRQAEALSQEYTWERAVLHEREFYENEGREFFASERRR